MIKFELDIKKIDKTIKGFMLDLKNSTQLLFEKFFISNFYNTGWLYFFFYGEE